jgi:hypothetical protein
MEQMLVRLLEEMKDKFKGDMKTMQDNADANQAKILDKMEANREERKNERKAD